MLEEVGLRFSHPLWFDACATLVFILCSCSTIWVTLCWTQAMAPPQEGFCVQYEQCKLHSSNLSLYPNPNPTLKQSPSNPTFQLPLLSVKATGIPSWSKWGFAAGLVLEFGILLCTPHPSLISTAPQGLPEVVPISQNSREWHLRMFHTGLLNLQKPTTRKKGLC